MNARKSALIAVAAIAGLASGFAFRWIQRGSPDAASTESPENAAKENRGAKGPASRAVAVSPPSALAAQLEQDLSISSGVTRWLHWMTTIEQASLSDFPRLARMAQGNSVAMRMVGARWLELDPQHMFDSLERAAREDAAGGPKMPVNDLAQMLFEEWSKRDPDAVIAALSGKDSTATRHWRYTVVNSVMKSDPERGLALLSDWRIDNYGPDVKAVAAWAEKDPRHAAEFALSHAAGFATETALAEIGKVWAKADPEAALAFVSADSSRFGSAFAASVVKSWADRDLAGAAAWLGAADPKTRARFSEGLMEVWAKTDTAAALDWSEQHLTGYSLDEAVASVLKGAAARNVTEAAELVTSMEPSSARAKAAASVARKWFPSWDERKPAPPEAIAWLTALDPVSMKQVIEGIQWQWTGNDAKGFADFLAVSASGPNGASLPPNAFFSTARALTRENPEEALKWAQRLPEDRRADATLNIFGEWQGTQPAAAAEWAEKLPAGDPRRETYYKAVLQQFVSSGPDLDAAMKALASDRSAARSVVAGLQMPDDRKALLLERLQLK